MNFHYTAIKIVSVMLISFMSYGQEVLEYTYDEFIQRVMDHHPLTKQAELQPDFGKATVLMARGAFDPKVEGDYNHKSFDEKNYYSLTEGALKIPTWYGVEFNAGYNRNNGEFLSNSDILPPRGLWNAGISVPLGRGLVLDDRRAELQKAKIFERATRQEQLLALNELILEAGLAYQQWQYAYAYLQIAQEGLELADLRFVATQGSFENGIKPAIDTLESLIAVQSRQQLLNEANQFFQESQFNLERFLWMDGLVPLEIDGRWVPEEIQINQFESTLDSLSLVQDNIIALHPEIQLYNLKLEQLEVDRKLGVEDLKPDLRVKYNPLITTTDNELFGPLMADNFKIGATFSYPLLLRKARGKNQLNKLKISETSLELTQKTMDLSAKLKTYLNNTRQLEEQVTITEQIVVDYDRLLKAENRKFRIGESSVFLVNSREIKYLESRIKLLDLKLKTLKNSLQYIFLSANLVRLDN